MAYPMNPTAASVASMLLLASVGSTHADTAAPSFACTRASGAVEKMICGDAALAPLDRRLADVYAAAATKAGTPTPRWLTAEQRGWIKGRNACWKDPDVRTCVEREYTTRIVELQARFRLVKFIGPVTFACTRTSREKDEIIATFHETDPPTVLVERGDRTILGIQARSGSGAKYEGANLMFWEHQGEAQVTWMDVNLTCKVQR